ncbi:hypothetical protein F5Y19DRAFT_458956 [Xylariaceae sp. FL1651]|nr:hypothetical protein F5Y19DRAFT_458956 [Xylariaceae sp. FL1651]
MFTVFEPSSQGHLGTFDSAALFLEKATTLGNFHESSTILLKTQSIFVPYLVLVWIHRIPGTGNLRLDEAANAFDSYLESFDQEKDSQLILRFKDIKSSTSYILIANLIKSSVSDCLYEAYDDEVLEVSSRKPMLRSFLSDLRNADHQPGPGIYPRESWRRLSFVNERSLRGAFLLVILLAIAIFLIPNTTSPPNKSSSSSETYVRYPTGKSVGPKYQLRIQWDNASDWTRTHPHDNGEWAFRMDDQALVPAHLYDEEEDSYQEWFRERYPHMTEVADRGDYVRPAWLGSRKVAIEWDSTFHDAHCILAFRRYFKAKETGKHVCARDIYPGHIKHCLDKLDAKYFIPGEMTRHEPKQYMYWQTKVCFGEDEL